MDLTANNMSCNSNKFIKGNVLSSINFVKNSCNHLECTWWHDTELVQYSICLSSNVDAIFGYNKVVVIGPVTCS